MTAVINLPTTTIASLEPDLNFSASTAVSVGISVRYGAMVGLFQIPNLPAPPAGTQFAGAFLQLGVLSQTGTLPSAIRVNRVTSPSPLAVETVTWNTPVLYTPTGITKAVSYTDIGQNIRIDVTSLVQSWYAAAPDPGLALTDASGSLAAFFSNRYSVPENRPYLVLDFEPVDTRQGKIVGHAVVSQEELVVATEDEGASLVRDISQKTEFCFFVRNTGSRGADVSLEISADGTDYVRQQPYVAVVPTQTVTLSDNSAAQYARLVFRSSVPGHSTSLTIQYVARA